MTKKIVKLVSSNDKLIEEAEQETAVVTSFMNELDTLLAKYSGDIADPLWLHPHDVIAILDTSKVAYQLCTVISLEDEE